MGGVTTFDICSFRCVTALALTTLQKPWVFAINICGFSFVVYNTPIFDHDPRADISRIMHATI
jgi:hypothetical protein